MTTFAPRYLTKSRFKLAVDCPTKLYYTVKKEYANLNDGNEFLETLADGGFQVGELAKFMYPEGIEIRAKGTDEAIADTAHYLSQENFTLFEPAIVFGNFLVRVDVLIKRGDSLQVIEVKAKSYSGDPASLSGKRKPIAGEYLPYVQDVAFQKYVVQQAFPHCSLSAHLLMPDKSKTAHVNGMNQWFKVQRNGRSTQVLVDERAKAPGLADSVLTCISVDHLANEVINTPIEIPGGQGSLAELAELWAQHYQADERIAPMIERLGLEEDQPLEAGMLTKQIEAAQKRPELGRVTTTFLPTVPQLFVDVLVERREVRIGQTQLRELAFDDPLELGLQKVLDHRVDATGHVAAQLLFDVVAVFVVHSDFHGTHLL